MYEHVDDDLYIAWLVKVKDLISKVCGEDSQHFKALVHATTEDTFKGSYDVFKSVSAIFIATKEDYENGYLSSYKAIVQAEIFDGELDQAKELLEKNYYPAAAVIAGVVLETTLRELCDRESIEHGKMDKMNSDLAKAGVYTKNMQKQLTALAGIRNSAAHGNSDEFTKQDVTQIIKAIELFLVNYHDT